MHRALQLALLGAAVGLGLIACTNASAQPHHVYGLGHAADPAEVAREDIDVAPDGANLPSGDGTAFTGATIFAASCQRCHGTAIRLAAQRWPYATTLFDYIRRAMPPDRETTLRANDVYALVAYELYMNGRLRQDERLDKSSLSRVTMPAIGGLREIP